MKQGILGFIIIHVKATYQATTGWEAVADFAWGGDENFKGRQEF